MHLPMQRRCEGARRRAHIDIDSESLIRVTGRGRCSPPNMRSIHKRTCARTRVTQHACMPRTHTHGGTHPHVTRDPSIHAHHATPERIRAHAIKHACAETSRCMNILLLLLHYFITYYLLEYSCCHAHARMYSFSADVHRIYEWGMLRATIEPAPCRPLHVVRLA